MPQLAFNRQLPTMWIVGGSGRLGLSISQNAELKFNVINLSRHDAKLNSDSFLNVAIDLSDTQKLKFVVKDLLHNYFPSAIIFCQRYRSSLCNNNEDDVVAGVKTEIISTQSIIEMVAATYPDSRCSIVLISSVNGIFVNKKIPFLYHFLKSSQIQLVKYYSVSLGKMGFRINCIVAGSFIRNNIEEYPEVLREWFAKLEIESPLGRNVMISDIVSVIDFLISDAAGIINGQVINLDGGMSNILQESIV